MIKYRVFKSIIPIFLVCTFLFNLSGCSANKNVTLDFTPKNIEISTNLENGKIAVNDFSVNFFKNSYKSGENVLVSPLSIIYALGMTSNGANGDTLSELENALGMKTEDLNLFLYSLIKNLNNTEKSKMSLVNSVWFTDDERFTLNDTFMQKNADYYGIDTYKVPFDSSTVNDINNWVDEKTNDMIDDIANNNSFSANTIMSLINALYFEAEWDTPYYKEDVSDNIFTASNGKKQNCEFMYGEESYYLANEMSTGFIKEYADSNYSFAALLPNENVTIDQFVKWLDHEKLSNTLNYKNKNIVNTAIPKFKTEFESNSVKTLNKMGIKKAFDPDNADFSLLGKSTSGNIYIYNILQKNTIEVAEKGTKAASISMVTFEDKAASMSKEIYLNRPFVYMIIDTKTSIPLFIGVLNSMD